MKYFKRILSLNMAIALLFTLTACGNNHSSSTKAAYKYIGFKGDDLSDDMYYDYSSITEDDLNNISSNLINNNRNNNSNRNNNTGNNNTGNGSNSDTDNSSSSNSDGTNRNENENGNGNGNKDNTTVETISWTKGNLTAPGDKYDIPKITANGGNAPIIVGATKQVAPDSTVVVTGDNFTSDTKAYYYAQNGDSAGKTYAAKLTRVSNQQVNVTIDKNTKYGVYGLYLENSSGKSAVQLVNVPKIWWIGINRVTAGDSLSIYGENLTTENGDQSNVYLLNDNGDYYKMHITYADPNKVTVSVPSGLGDGKSYTIKLHNGHGGEYAWTTADEKLIYSSTKINEWTGKTVDVTSYGAKGDGSTDCADAVKKAINAASNGDILYFPKGSYLLKSAVDVDKSLHIKGAGADTSKIIIPRTSKAKYIINILNQITEISDLGFEYKCGAAKLNTGFITFKGDSVLTDTYNLYVHNCKFLQETTFACQLYGIYVTGTSFIVKNNFFETTGVLYSNMTEKLIITNNEVCGVALTGTYVGQDAFLTWSTDKADISDNKIYGKDIVTDPDGTLSEVGDRTVGRTLAAQQSLWNLYFSHNKLERVGLPGDNAGEQIMFEDRNNIYVGGVKEATANTITIAENPSTPPKKGSLITITNGKGFSQYRYISKYIGAGKFELSEPWTIIPDSTSVVLIDDCFINISVTENDITGFKTYDENYTATSGIQVYGNFHNGFLNRNKFKNVSSGISFSSHYTMDDSPTETNIVYWCQAEGNNFSNLSTGIYVLIVMKDTKKSEAIPMHSSCGLVVRSNNFSDISDLKYTNKKGLSGVGISVGQRHYSFNGQPPTLIWNGDWEYGTVIENNSFTNCENHNIILCKHQGGTMLRNNKVSGKISTVFDKENYPGITVNDPIIVE